MLTKEAYIKKRNKLLEEAEKLLDEGKVDEYKEKEQEIKDLDAKFEKVSKAQANMNALKDSAPVKNDFIGDDEPKDKDDKDNFVKTGGFDNLGDFVQAVRFKPYDERLEKLRNMSTSEGSEGGILVPEQFRTQILQMEAEDAIVRPRATVIPAGNPPDAKINLPALQQGAGGVYNGITFTATAEGEEMDEMDGPSLEDIGIEPAEQSGYVTVTNKLLRNSEAASAFLARQLRGGKAAYEDHLFLSKGDGVNKPLAVLNTPGAIEVERNTSTEILYEDVLNMEKAMLPNAIGGAYWIASQSAYKYIKDMKDSNDNRIYKDANLVKGVPASLDGFPLKFTGRAKTLGNRGDLMFVDLGYYLIKDGSGLFIDASKHVKFKSNKTVIKIVWNVDGQSWVNEPLTLEDGSTKASPIVVLK